jgi:Protein of unknown function (DUF3039)
MIQVVRPRIAALGCPSRHYTEPVTTRLSPGVETVEDRRTQETDDPGDHDRFSHYARKDKLTEAMVMGTPVVALCGKVWVPSRDPKKYPVCPTCKEIWESLSDGGDAQE